VINYIKSFGKSTKDKEHTDYVNKKKYRDHCRYCATGRVKSKLNL